jgi:hypothetical protein
MNFNSLFLFFTTKEIVRLTPPLTPIDCDCVEKIVEVRKEEGLRRYIRMRFRIEGS